MENITPLKRVRKKLNLSLRIVAEAVKTNPGNLSRIENGKQKTTPDLAEKLSTFFGQQVSEVQILYPERFMDTNRSTQKTPSVS